MSFAYFNSRVVLALDSARCRGCGTCVSVCPHDVFEIAEMAPQDPAAGGVATTARRRARIVHAARCMECGACALNCPFAAIHAGSGVGCATAIIYGMLRGTAPACDCSGGGSTPRVGCGPKDCGPN